MVAHLQRLHIEGFGCLREVTLKLTPIHALIGPNDSGKTTTLRVLRLLLQLCQRGFHREDGVLQPFEPPFSLVTGKAAVRAAVGSTEHLLAISQNVISSFSYEGGSIQNLSEQRDRHGGSAILSSAHIEQGKLVRANRTEGSVTAGGLYFFPPEIQLPPGVFRAIPPAKEELRRLASALKQRPRVLRLDPDALRAPSASLPGKADLFFRDERGTGLAAVLEALRDRDEDGYQEIASRLREKFPTVKSLRLERSDDGTRKSVAVTLRDGTDVSAESLSEGMLYFLAFLAVGHLEPAFFLIEEPENGLHPTRIGEVIGILREMAKTSQVLLATHSPLVVNEFEASEVTVLRRTEENGTTATLLADTKDYPRRSQIYANGELWLNYANGVDEAPLVEGGERP